MGKVEQFELLKRYPVYEQLEDLDAYNAEAAMLRQKLGMGDEPAIRIVESEEVFIDTYGRTPTAAYLGSLTKGEYLVSQYYDAIKDQLVAPYEEFIFNDWRRHDEVTHFNAIAVMHPQTARYVMDIASHGQAALAEQDIETADTCGSVLDVMLTPNYMGNIIRYLSPYDLRMPAVVSAAIGLSTDAVNAHHEEVEVPHQQRVELLLTQSCDS